MSQDQDRKDAQRQAEIESSIRQAQSQPSREITDDDVRSMLSKVPGYMTSYPMSRDGELLVAMLQHYLALRRQRPAPPLMPSGRIHFDEVTDAKAPGVPGTGVPPMPPPPYLSPGVASLEVEAQFCPVLSNTITRIRRGVPEAIACSQALLFLSRTRRELMAAEIDRRMREIPDPRMGEARGLR